jgi:hypothetical protein
VARRKRLFRIIMKSSSTMEKMNGCLNYVSRENVTLNELKEYELNEALC